MLACGAMSDLRMALISSLTAFGVTRHTFAPKSASHRLNRARRRHASRRISCLRMQGVAIVNRREFLPDLSSDHALWK